MNDQIDIVALTDARNAIIEECIAAIDKFVGKGSVVAFRVRATLNAPAPHPDVKVGNEIKERSQQQSQLISEIEALDLLKAEILKFGSQRKWCKEHLISNQYVSDILTGKVAIGKSVQAALGIRRVIMYEKVENGK